ncbi:unnamed protein product [Cutaneotrichosporon oleaginosum]
MEITPIRPPAQRMPPYCPLRPRSTTDSLAPKRAGPDPGETLDPDPVGLVKRGWLAVKRMRRRVVP